MPSLQQCTLQSPFIHNVIFSNLCYVIHINLITLRAMCNIVELILVKESIRTKSYFNVTSQAFKLPNYEGKKLLCNRHHRIYVAVIERGMRKCHLKVHST